MAGGLGREAELAKAPLEVFDPARRQRASTGPTTG